MNSTQVVVDYALAAPRHLPASRPSAPSRAMPQSTHAHMMYDLNTALMRAARDDSIRVIITGNERHFSTSPSG